MPDPLLVTKIRLPALRHLFVSRQKVLDQLCQGYRDGHVLTLVSAPAGYGKTTTIRMWVEGLERPVAWVSLDKSDNDFKQFLMYFLNALGQGRENLGQAALEVVEKSQAINPQHILGLLIKDLCELDEPIVLVLEDYHLIENEKIDQVIESILNQAIANFHMVITTREDPNLPLARLRVRNQLTEIRAMDLSFSLKEAGDFLSNVMRVKLQEKEIETVNARTEGWVAGLQLAALSLKDSRDPAKSVEAFRGTHRHFLDYLIEEVLNSQPEAIREFLRQTSILDQLSPPLCEAVTGQADSEKYLHYMETNNLFVVALDEERNWYRYHALFGELLRNQLYQVEPERVDDLYGRAADWYEKKGFISRAVEYAFKISTNRRASELIEKHALPMLYQGEVSAVGGWYDRIPKSLIQSSPISCLGKAWSLVLMLRRARAEEVKQALQDAHDALNLVNADEALRNFVAGHSASIQAYLLRSPAFANERPETLIETSQKAQSLLPKDERAIRSVNALNIGYGYAALADLPAAETAFQQAFEDGMAGRNLYAAIYGPINLIMIAIIKGRLKDALQLCETNIDRFNRLLAGQNFPPIGSLYILKGSILLEENRLAEADQALTLGINLIRYTGELTASMRGYSDLARLRSTQGDLAGMLENIKLLEETRPEGSIYAQSLHHLLSVRGWPANNTNLENAHLWMTQAAVKFNNFPDITGFDPLNQIYFQSFLSAAHVLTRLARKNPQAYSLLEFHDYLKRQEKFAEAHGFAGWLVEIWILKALMYQVEGRTEDAYQMIQAALGASAQQGYFRIYLDEGDLLRPLLESVEPRLKDTDLSAVIKRLLEAMPEESAKGKQHAGEEQILRDRETEVLGLLAAGKSYKEIGQRLYLSLNTVQFHVKNIYSKLSVNSRAQALEKAREMNLL